MDHYEGKYTRLIYNEIQFLASYILVFWFSYFNHVMHTLVFNFQISTISCNNLYSIISDTYVPKFLNFSMLHNESHDWLCTISGTKVYLTTNLPNVPSTTGTPIIHTVHGTKMYSSSTVLINTITLSKSTFTILTQCFILQKFWPYRCTQWTYTTEEMQLGFNFQKFTRRIPLIYVPMFHNQHYSKLSGFYYS